MKYRILSVMLMGCLFFLTACPKQTPLEEDPQERAQAEKIGHDFVGALFALDYRKMTELSAIPFLVEDDVFLTMAELENEFKRELEKEETSPEFEILELQFYTVRQIAQHKPRFWSEIQKHGFSNDSIYVLVISINIETIKEPEEGILLLKKDNHGYWKVIGIGGE